MPQSTIRDRRLVSLDYTRISDSLTGANASTTPIGVETYVTYIATDGTATNNPFSLPDGITTGQRKILHLTAKGGIGTAVVTPSNLHGGTTVTLSAVEQSSELMWLNGAWKQIAGDATVA